MDDPDGWSRTYETMAVIGAEEDNKALVYVGVQISFRRLQKTTPLINYS